MLQPVVQKILPKYTSSKDGIIYYVRRVPKPIRSHYRLPVIRISLRTRHPEIARKRANKINNELERDWEHLMFSSVSVLVDGFRKGQVINNQVISPDNSPTLTEAMDFYFSAKGNDRTDEFYRSVRRAVSYLCGAVGDKPITEYSRMDANQFRDYLLNIRKVNASSARRVISSVKAIITFTSRENDLPPNTAFSSIHFAEPKKGLKERDPIPPDVMHRLQLECLDNGDQSRLLIALLTDSGMRLSEALGLACNDIVLDSPTPHIIVREHPWRRLKTDGSERVIPLVGVSKIAAERLIASSDSNVLITKYCDGHEVKSNSASAALNKWLKTRVPKNCVVHSTRHSFRDRLRAVSCPTDVVDELGGWAASNIGQKYGQGYSLEVKSSWMLEMVKASPVSKHLALQESW